MNEIRYRFLLSSDIKRWLKRQTFTLEKIEQFYLSSEDGTECYLQKISPNMYTRVNVDRGGNRSILRITKEEYTFQKKSIIGKKVVKKVYTVSYDKEKFVVYEYLKRLKGLYILESYFCDTRLAATNIIDTLQTFVLRDISRDEKYSHRSLALYSKPMEYDIYKFFEKIDAYEAANLFFWQVPKHIYVRDAVTLVLYKNLRLMHYYMVNYQRKHYAATLHRLRVLLRRTAILLEIFLSLFNPNVARFGINLLMRYYEETKRLQYLYFLEEMASTKKNTTLSLHSVLKSFILEEERAVLQMLYGKPFKQLIQILTRELYEEGYHQSIALKKEVKKVAREHLNKIETLLEKSKESQDGDFLEKLYIKIDSLQALIEDFYHILGKEKTQLLAEEMSILLKPLREYRNCKTREEILLEIKKESNHKRLDISPLLCTHTDRLAAKIGYALKLLRTSKFYI